MNADQITVGGTSGIGEFTLKAFVRSTVSPRVYLVGRNASAADRIITECRTLNKDGKVEFLKADVTELKEVDRVCEQIQKREKKINLLVQTQGNLTLNGRNGGVPLAIHAIFITDTNNSH
jgi:NADP-dependent 3-hydroxy acid dehydrogenase YdfG